MINSIDYNDWTFNIIEEKISEFLCELGSDILRKFLEWLDDDICNNKNKKICFADYVVLLIFLVIIFVNNLFIFKFALLTMYLCYFQKLSTDLSKL
jgi:hypothetical protein